MGMGACARAQSSAVQRPAPLHRRPGPVHKLTFACQLSRTCALSYRVSTRCGDDRPRAHGGKYGALCFRGPARRAARTRRPLGRSTNAAAGLCYTSAPTSAPKGVLYSHTFKRLAHAHHPAERCHGSCEQQEGDHADRADVQLQRLGLAAPPRRRRQLVMPGAEGLRSTS